MDYAGGFGLGEEHLFSESSVVGRRVYVLSYYIL